MVVNTSFIKLTWHNFAYLSVLWRLDYDTLAMMERFSGWQIGKTGFEVRPQHSLKLPSMYALKDEIYLRYLKHSNPRLSAFRPPRRQR